MWAVSIFFLEALHWSRSFERVRISWNAFVKNAHVLLQYDKPSLEYVNVLFDIRAVLIFSLEAWFWKIITLFPKGKNFMKCFCEKRTCVTLKWDALVWNMSKFCSHLEQCSLSLYKLYFVGYSRSLDRVWISWYAFGRNAHVILSNEKP